MPEISRFHGIVIGMFYREHGPPHFHAVHGEFEMIVDIETRRVSGHFPRRSLELVLEWARVRHVELLANWELARKGRALRTIAPLE